MQFRDLQTQYIVLKDKIDSAMIKVATDSNFISGNQVKELEMQLADYVGVKHCITCANGTDALSLALMAWGIGKGDAVFVPDFTFFASAEVVSYEGATPIFVDVDENTFNISTDLLEQAIQKVIKDGKLIPKVIISVDLFGQPAEYPKIKEIAEKYKLYLLEDAAQGFGGSINQEKACSFGHVSTTSFFPAKPLGCYGDGGAVFTDDDDIADLIGSLRIHGKGKDKYDNVRIGMNSRLDTIQAAILQVKLEAFINYELEAVNSAAELYTKNLSSDIKTPKVLDGYYSSWAQYTIQLKNNEQRNGLQEHLKKQGIPTMVYYQNVLHKQLAFQEIDGSKTEAGIAYQLSKCVLSLPLHPYIKENEILLITDIINNYCMK